MPIVVDVKLNKRMPSIGVRGSVGFLEGAQLKDIGAFYVSARKAQDERSAFYEPEPQWRSGHYELPLPLAKRLFEGNGTVKQPLFMRNWREYIDNFSDEWSPDHPIFKKLRVMRVTEEAVGLFEKWERFESILKSIKEGDENVINSILESHGVDDKFFDRQPKAHQKAGLAFFLASLDVDCGHVCLFDEMRTGKTLQAINMAKYALENKIVKGVLVVVPNSIKRIWLNELLTDDPLHAFVGYIVKGNKQQKKGVWESKGCYWIVNYECARADEDYLNEWAERMDKRGGWMLICDEAHKLKNPNSLQSKTILSLNPKLSVLMTGTPVANRPEDAWAMSNFVSTGILGESIDAFYEGYAIRGGKSGRDITGYRNLDEVKYRLARISMRRLRKDVMFDQTVRQTRFGDMDGAQKEAYTNMRDVLYAELMSDAGEWTVVKARSALAKIVRLQQIADGYLSPSPNEVQWFPDNWKFRELDQFIDEYLDDIGKLVIWSRFVPVILQLASRYERHGSLYIRGQMGERGVENMYKFQQDPNSKIMVSQIQTSEGKGFQPATFCIFYDKWWSPHLNRQAEDRIVGIKNPVPVTSISLVTEESIDERMEFLLNMKKGWAESITGDVVEDINLPVMDKETLLYLLARPDEAKRYETKHGGVE